MRSKLSIAWEEKSVSGRAQNRWARHRHLQNQVMAAGNYDKLTLAAPAKTLARCDDDKLQCYFTNR